jgi:hypothetical protein
MIIKVRGGDMTDEEEAHERGICIQGCLYCKQEVEAEKREAGVKIEETLTERGSTYGDFTVNAEIAQQIKKILHDSPAWGTMVFAHREALDVIASKISRIVTGDPDYSDNWHDIQGYAKLAGDRCRPPGAVEVEFKMPDGASHMRRDTATP